MKSSSQFERFFLPALNRRYLTRLIFLGLCCYLVFSYFLIPLRIQGRSMEPTYHDTSFAFCFRPLYFFSQIKRFDVVTVRFAGKNVMLLKRVVGLPGEILEFRKGVLYINGEAVQEPYVQYHSSWNLPPRKIKAEHVYVVGDNRETSMSRHRFGQVEINRVLGGVIP